MGQERVFYPPGKHGTAAAAARRVTSEGFGPPPGELQGAVRAIRT